MSGAEIDTNNDVTKCNFGGDKMGVTNKSTKTETMTKEKAIEMITKDIKLHGKYLSGQYREALKLAVDVLKESIASDSARH